MDKVQIAEIPFPLNGVDVSRVWEFQPPLTCMDAENVRGYEPMTNRNRGGSRAGLSRWNPQQVSGFNLIQELNIIVITDGSAVAFEGGGDTPPGFGFDFPFGFGFDINFEPPVYVSPFDLDSHHPPISVGGAGRLIVVKANPNIVPADGTTAEVGVWVYDRAGTPLSAEGVTLITSPAGRVGDGMTGTTGFLGDPALFTVSDTHVEIVTYSASATNRPFKVKQKAMIDYVERWTYTTADPTEAPADGGLSVTIFVRMTDNRGNIVPFEIVELITNPPGKVGDTQQNTTDSTGVTFFQVGDDTVETVQYSAKSITHTPYQIKQTATVRYTPIREIRVSATPTSAATSGTPNVIVTINFQLSDGTPIVGETVTLHTIPTGEVGDGQSGATDGNGNRQFPVNDTVAETVNYSGSAAPPYRLVNTADVVYGGGGGGGGGGGTGPAILCDIETFINHNGGGSVSTSLQTIQLMAHWDDGSTPTGGSGVIPAGTVIGAGTWNIVGTGAGTVTFSWTFGNGVTGSQNGEVSHVGTIANFESYGDTTLLFGGPPFPNFDNQSVNFRVKHA